MFLTFLNKIRLLFLKAANPAELGVGGVFVGVFCLFVCLLCLVYVSFWPLFVCCF